MRTQNENSVAFFESIRHYMTCLLDQKNHAEAVRYYEANRNELERLGGAEAGAIMHLAAKAYASLTCLPIALKAARMAQNLVAEEGDSRLLAEIFLTIGGILRDMSEFKEAEVAFRDAESIFRRNDSLEGRCRALNLLAGLFFKRNDYRNSMTVLMDAIEIARKLGDKKKLAYMVGNIGRISTFTGDFGEAKKNLKINVELSEELGDRLEVARAYRDIAYVYIQEAEYRKAEEALAQAYPLILESQSAHDEAIYTSYLGELKYRSGQLLEAQDVLEKALAMAEVIAPDGLLAGRVMRHLAEVHIRLSNHRAAQRYCSRSWVIMEKTGNKVELGALGKIKAMLAEAENRLEECRSCYIRAIDCLAESGVRFEKADALVAAGCSAVFTDRQRLTYLFRAAEFYALCDLKQKQNEVEKLIDAINHEPRRTPVECQPTGDDRARTYDFPTCSPAIVQFKNQLPLFGRTDLPILLCGETGVGKDHMARYFHSLVRPHAPFVAINCASLPETLLESELFGYNRGAFTGADGNKQGLFVAANGGVLFLDEIGDMPLSLQTKLLGVLENRRLTPLGTTVAIDLDIKIIAATNRNLEEMVEQGTFRRDLYYRLSGLTFEIPPLRRRKEDIPLLLNQFMTRCGLIAPNEVLPPELVQQFVEYDWPGNTRELYNKVKRLEVMAQMVAEGDLIELSRSMFNADIRPAGHSLYDRVEQFEQKIIVEALLAAGGNKSEAARMLGIHEATVRTKLKRYGINMERAH